MIRRTVAAAAAVLVLTACTAPGRENEATRDTGDTLPGASAAAQAGTRTLTKADFKLTIKVTDKECFGSAGCNVGFRVQAGWPSWDQGDRDYEVTYTITGPEDGAQIGTITVHPDGTYTGGEGYASTPRSKTVLKVTVTDVERAPY